MKKLVIINFDDMFINVSRIICKLLNSLEIIQNKKILISEDDIGCDLEKPLSQLFYSVLEDYDVSINEDTVAKLIDEFENILIPESILADGLQSFLMTSKNLEIETIVISNKPLSSVKKCVYYYTHDSINGIYAYNDPYDGGKLIERLINERNLSYQDALIISKTDFNDEFLKIYEYNKDYCSENIFSNYENIICLLDDVDMELPLLTVSLDINVKNQYYDIVYNLVKDVVNNIDVVDCHNNLERIIIMNTVETKCSQEDGESMYLENIIDNCLNPFYKNEKLLKQIREDYECDLFLSCTIYVESSKVNPCISPNKKIVEFLAKNEIELDYELYC